MLNQRLNIGIKNKLLLCIFALGIILLQSNELYAEEDFTTATALDVTFKASSDIIMNNDEDPGTVTVDMQYYPLESNTLRINSFEPFPIQPTKEIIQNQQKLQYKLQDIKTLIQKQNNQIQDDNLLNKDITNSNDASEIEKLENQIIEIGYTATIHTEQGFVKIPSKITYPSLLYPTEVLQYVQPSISADSTNPKIRVISQEIIGEEEDLFIATLRLASWVSENVEYNLSSQNVEASFPASWVLEHKQGVCDEITNLFIALCRSQGIPARFVSGISYSNSPEVPAPWGAHGWSEVYFPTIGWVPFDVTYRQYGYVDPTHIPLAYHFDAKDPEVIAEWNKPEAKINLGHLHTEIIEAIPQGSLDAIITPKMTVLLDYTGLDSYNMITIEVQNPYETYLAPSFTLQPTEGISIISKPSQLMVLTPHETKKASWIIKTKEGFDPEYIYTIPLAITSSYGGTTQTNFKADRQGINAGENEKKAWEESLFTNSLDIKKRSTEKYTAKVICDSERVRQQTILQEDKVTIECSITKINTLVNRPHEPSNQPTSNTSITSTSTTNTSSPNNSYQICSLSKCTKIVDFESKLEQQEEIKIPLELSTNIIGPQVISVAVYTNEQDIQITPTEFIPYMVNEKPSITISVASPKSVSYDTIFNVSVDIIRNTSSIPYTVKLDFNHPTFDNTIDIGTLENQYSIWLPLEGNFLQSGMNTITITIHYTDIHGNKYTTQKMAYISLDNLTFFQKISLWFRDVGLLLQNKIQG